MKFSDKRSKNTQALLGDLVTALSTSDNEAEIKEVVTEYSASLAQDLQDQVDEKVTQFHSANTDERIMAERTGKRVLTSGEKKYFAEAVEKQKLDGLDLVFPTTIVEDVMAGLTTDHPLLSEVDTKYVTYAMKYIYGDPAEEFAFWDVIPADIRQILIGGFKEMDLTTSKLSGYIALPKGYYKLGASWLANYVITFLKEVMSSSLEKAVVTGDGRLKPIGLTKKLSGAIDGEYPDKDVVKLTDFSPRSLAGPRALLAKNKMLDGNISLLTSPVTYETKVSPNMFFQNQIDGTWKRLPMPNGEKVVLSDYVPENKAILGNLKNYILAVAGNTEIKKYEETLAIEDMDLYIAKFFGTGTPKNPNAFVVLDLSQIDGITVPVDEPAAEIVAQDGLSPRANAGSHALDRDGKPTGAEVGTGTGGNRGVKKQGPETGDPQV